MLSPWAAATSSRVEVEKEDRPIGTPAFLQARAVAISPSGWAKHCMAVGATPREIDCRTPKRPTDVSIWEMSRRTRGLIRYFAYDWMFSSSVEPESAPSL